MYKSARPSANVLKVGSITTHTIRQFKCPETYPFLILGNARLTAPEGLSGVACTTDYADIPKQSPGLPGGQVTNTVPLVSFNAFAAVPMNNAVFHRVQPCGSRKN
jgi:hypothetical protein